MSFSIQLNRFHKKSLKQCEDAAREIQLRLFRAVVLDTPVLEGTLRGNWQLTKGTPANGTVDGTSDPMPDIEAALRSFRLGETVYLTNNLPYAYPIEFYGWSHTKAPQGMVRKNVLRLNRIAAAVVREVNR